MPYEAWEREHDRNLIKTLKSVPVTEQTLNDGSCLIKLAHLSGRISFCDGIMYWSVLGEARDSKPVDQTDIDRSAARLFNYRRTAVRNELEQIVESVIKSAKRRLEAAGIDPDN